MKGFIYRLGTAVKDAGERRRIRWLICLGKALRDWVTMGTHKK
jgi:hypothetical protein